MINTGLEIGQQSQVSLSIEVGSSAVRDGITTFVKESINPSGLFMRNGYWRCVLKLSGTNGQIFLNISPVEPTTLSKTIGIAR